MRMDFVTALNGPYMRYSCVLFTSILETQLATNDIYFHVLHSSLTNEQIEAIDSQISRYANGHVSFIWIDKEDFSDFKIVDPMWSLETNYRLKAPDVLPLEVERFLYLDIDTICLDRLDELFEYDFKGAHLLGREDGNQPPFSDSRDNIFSRWIADNSLKYICAGVVLWNLKEIRKETSFDSYIRAAESINYSMRATDQDLINLVHQGHIDYFSDAFRYGVFAKIAYTKGYNYQMAKKETAIIHYVGQKPWQGQYIHYDVERIWWEYAKLTPFYVELMEEYLEAGFADSIVYDSYASLASENQNLKEQLQKSVELNQKFLAILQKQ